MTIRRVWQLCLLILGMGIWSLPGWLSADVALPAGTGTAADMDSATGRVDPAGLSGVKLDVGLSAGLRNDDLSWSKAGTMAAYPNITSELVWTNIESYQVILHGAMTLGSHVYGRGALGYAVITDGQVRDSDYRGDNRTEEYSRSISKTANDNLWDVTAGGGPMFSLASGRLMVAPLMGFSIHRQNLRITDGTQVIASEALPATPTTPATEATPPLGPLDDRLNSVFQATWQGPWVGLDLSYRVGQLWAADMAATLSLEYHFAVAYSATADWNLRADLSHPESFDHRAHGRGLIIRGGWQFSPLPQFTLSLDLTYQHWKTRSGTMTMYYADNPAQSSPLNPVEWENISLCAGVTLRI